MEITSTKEIQVLITLRKINRTSQAIKRNNAVGDFMGVKEFERVKDQLTKELQALLAKMEVKLPIAL